MDPETGNGTFHFDDKKPCNLRVHPRWAYLKSGTWLKPLMALILLYVAGSCVVIFLFSRLPAFNSVIESDEAMTVQAKKLTLSLPHDFDELRQARQTLELYREAHALDVLILLTACYIFLQTFMMPGAVAINILAGSLYPFWSAMSFTSIVSTIGASCNFWLIKLILRDVVKNIFPSKVQAFELEVQRHHANLFHYMLFLRVTPLLPAWFINLGSPIVGVPFTTFLIATAIGHQGVNFFTVEAGETLATMNSMADLWSIQNIALLCVAGAVALIPVVWGRSRASQKMAIAAGVVGKDSSL